MDTRALDRADRGGHRRRRLLSDADVATATPAAVATGRRITFGLAATLVVAALAMLAPGTDAPDRRLTSAHCR
jgi:hypothetical protein